MFDRRYPNLVRPEHAPEDRRAAAVRICRAVCGRAHCQAAYDRGSGSLFFYAGEPWRGLCWQRFFTVKGDRRYLDEQLVVDQACRDIYQGRVPMDRKMREVRWAQERDRLDAMEEEMKKFEDSIPDALKNLKRQRSRRGMSRRHRPSAVIDRKV